MFRWACVIKQKKEKRNGDGGRGRAEVSQTTQGCKLVTLMKGDNVEMHE